MHTSRAQSTLRGLPLTLLVSLARVRICLDPLFFPAESGITAPRPPRTAGTPY